MSERVLEILRPGPQSIVVDRGRFGFRAIGVAWCGAMDAPALQRALTRLSERGDAAALEIAYGGFACRFSHAAQFSLAGADCEARLDGAALAAECAVDVAGGATLELRPPTAGSRTILAVRGGIDVPPVMGSRTTDLAAGMGGFAGRALLRGDRIPLGDTVSCALTHEDAPGAGHGEPSVRVMRTHEHERFSSTSRAAFWSQAWNLSHQSNRMGYRFDGPQLAFEDRAPVRSHAVFPGVIQVPPDGMPIVLMSDAHTTGGYPKIGVVIPEDLWRVAQMRAGERLRFIEVPR